MITQSFKVVQIGDLPEWKFDTYVHTLMGERLLSAME